MKKKVLSPQPYQDWILDLVDSLQDYIEEVTPIEDQKEKSDENQGDPVLLVLLRGLKTGSKGGINPNRKDG